MKAVIISDLHGNYDALNALPESYDELWVLGDLVNYGPEPSLVVNFISTHASHAVRGNHDHAVGFEADPRCTLRYREMAAATQKVSLAQLNETQKEFLRGLPAKEQVQCDGKRVYLCHAKPSDPLYGYCPADSDDWIAEVETTKSDILLVGHTHTPFIRRIGERIVCNPGSLGQPKTGRPDACYALWQDGVLELKSFAYPVETTIKKINALPMMPEIKRDLITVLQTGDVKDAAA
jgi:putative phosphoesterase